MAKDKQFGRTFLYHKTQPLGKIFDDKKEHDEALKAGWTTAPYTIGEVKKEVKEEVVVVPESKKVDAIPSDTPESLNEFLDNLKSDEPKDPPAKKRGNPNWGKKTFD